MEEVKKIKKKRFNFLKFIIFVLFIYLIISVFLVLYKSPIKNIIILNNNYLSDEKIIETAKIDNYPSFIKTTRSSICKKLYKIDLIKSCSVKKKLGFIIEITALEYKILYKMRSNNKYILESGKFLESIEDIKGIPLLINYIPDDINKGLNDNFSKLDEDVLYKISEIEYSPTSYDNERFILYMKDGNMVYITLNKTSKLNKYNEIKKELDNHKGILYLDSGNYFEIK